MSGGRAVRTGPLLVLLAAAVAFPSPAPAIEAQAPTSEEAGAYESVGDNVLTLVLYRRRGSRVELAAMIELEGRIEFGPGGIVSGEDNLRRLKLAEHIDRWLGITGVELVDGRAMVTTEDGKTHAVFNLGIGPFAGEIASPAETASDHPADPPTMSVEDAQATLAKLGYDPGPLDGLWGRRTKAAVVQFQKDRNLPVTGTLDVPTASALGSR